MIASDTSVWINFSKGVDSSAVQQLEAALSAGNLILPLPVFFEIVSSPGLAQEAENAIQQLPQLEILPGFWKRAGHARRSLLQQGLKARGMDCLIAQNCMDHDIPLIAEDDDFRHFQKLGLKIV